MSNGVNPHTSAIQTPLQMHGRPSLSTPGPSTVSGSSSGSAAQAPVRQTPKAKTKVANSSLPAPPLDDVHSAFVEFRAKEEDKVGISFFSLVICIF